MKGRFRLPTPALVLSMVALSIVLGGSALAAARVTGTDTKADTKLVKKLAPKLTVKAAKVAGGAVVALVAQNADQLGGLAASAYQRSTLPSGQTESGDYAVSGSGTGGIPIDLEEGIQFAIPLQLPLASDEVNFLATGNTSLNCPGVGQAAAGTLCVYEGHSANLTTPGEPFSITDQTGKAGADATGFVIHIYATDGTNAFSYGSWTVKAP